MLGCWTLTIGALSNETNRSYMIYIQNLVVFDDTKIMHVRNS